MKRSWMRRVLAWAICLGLLGSASARAEGEERNVREIFLGDDKAFPAYDEPRSRDEIEETDPEELLRTRGEEPSPEGEGDGWEDADPDGFRAGPESHADWTEVEEMKEEAGEPGDGMPDDDFAKDAKPSAPYVPPPPSTPPKDWYQVNEDGFLGYPCTSGYTRMFVFGKNLYAYNDYGLFRMVDPAKREWKKLSVPVKPGSWKFLPSGKYLYMSGGNNQLWFIQEGGDLKKDWKQVTSTGLSGGASPWVMITFNGQIYIFWNPTYKPFELWRSKDIGKTTMAWKRVVENSFGDPTNNKEVSVMAEFNGKLYAGTDTLKYVFGAPNGKYDGGSEVWESSTGNPGSWKQVNVDGFGTNIPYQGKKLYTNHVIGCAVATKDHLYIGTKSHWGAEVWRYDGTGKKGWKNITPSWAGPDPFLSSAGRNEGMVLFQGYLYMAEGYPGGGLGKYDGKSWCRVVTPPPFNAHNGGLGSLAVLKDKLFVSTLHLPYSGVTKGDQVWGYAYPGFHVAGVTLKAPGWVKPADTKYKVVVSLTFNAAIDKGSLKAPGTVNISLKGMSSGKTASDIAGTFHLSKDGKTAVFVSNETLGKLLNPGAGESLRYTITVKGVKDPAGTALDGDLDGKAGGEYKKTIDTIG